MKALFRNESNRADLIPALAALVAAMMALLLTTPRILAANMSDGFESYATGYLDSNTAGGPNTGSSNPWWGPNPANFRVAGAVNGVTPHSGTKMIWTQSAGGGTVGAYSADNDQM